MSSSCTLSTLVIMVIVPKRPKCWLTNFINQHLGLVNLLLLYKCYIVCHCRYCKVLEICVPQNKEMFLFDKIVLHQFAKYGTIEINVK